MVTDSEYRPTGILLRLNSPFSLADAVLASAPTATRTVAPATGYCVFRSTMRPLMVCDSSCAAAPEVKAQSAKKSSVFCIFIILG
jgi:hypothetical protein